MTFTSYFSYVFRGESSYENTLILGDLTSTQRMADVFSILRKILWITFIVETVGVNFVRYIKHLIVNRLQLFIGIP